MFAVTPVIEYEPPTRGLRRHLPSSPSVRPRTAQPARMGSAAAHPGDRPSQRQYGAPPSPQMPPSPHVPPSPLMRQAAVFADSALRRVLEVIDRRRPAAQLGSMLAYGQVEALRAVAQAVADEPGVAVLRRIRLQPAGRPGRDTAAEVFGTYSRGERMHAIACRVQRLPGAGGGAGRWLVVALHIG
ncbi:Rv3235 family protein [Mycobacterium sp.]|uniref:Rv3235 family protein n=1 Tax=Mycobacterium sp. TaxID=1785 RepID=UPI003A8BE9EC